MARQTTGLLVPGSGRTTRRDEGTTGADAATRDALAGVLCDVLGTPDIGVDRDFFADLGADSLVMARFCARVRKRPELPPVSMKDVYRHPTIAGLAAALGSGAPTTARSVPVPVPTAPAPASRRRYVLCGILQLLAFLGYSYLVAVLTVWGYDWISAASGAGGVYLRSVLFGAVTLLGVCGLPIVAKWALIGRWTPRSLPVWSLAYVRFWLVKTLLRFSPMVLFAGSPVYVQYLRALGARIGPGATILTRNPPICTDLLTVGAGAVVRKDAFLTGYRARAGRIETGRVALGEDAVVGEASVLDIDTRVGERSQLGHASTLHAGQEVPDGEHWHGSPAERTGTDYSAVEPAVCGSRRRATHAVVQLLTVLFGYLPLAVGGIGILLAEAPSLAAVVQPGSSALADGAFYGETLALSLLLFFVAIPVGLLLVAVVPRLLRRVVTPGRVYPLYGFHYGVHQVITFLTNRRFLTRLFGDSSAVVHYLRWLGYDLSRIQQTGSNFGTDVRHQNPFLTAVGTGTMVADGLSVNNADYSSTSFRVTRTAIGPRNFLGNKIAYPARGRTGDNCLLATKVMVPVDGKVRAGVGLLGSPAFEIPRTVERDRTFDRLRTGDELRRGLAAKNRHNAATMGLYLLARWLWFFWVTLLYSCAAELQPSLGAGALALANVLLLVTGIGYVVLVERRVTRSGPPGKLFCSIYDRRFWRRERYWKVPSAAYLQILSGTPFKNVLWRLLGVRIGRRVFDDGASFTERTMVTVGDDCTLNAGSVVQCHSQEDGTFKSDHSTLGAGCTLGVGAFAHYGVTVGDGAVLAADSFLMKGEDVPPRTHWGGNPARPLHQAVDTEWRR